MVITKEMKLNCEQARCIIYCRMSAALLSTKLNIPYLPVNTITRPRLTGKLLALLERPGGLALLSGPAGFGKTTLFLPGFHSPTFLSQRKASEKSLQPRDKYRLLSRHLVLLLLLRLMMPNWRQ